MFPSDPDSDRTVILDFQTVRLGAPGVDLAYFLGGSLQTDVRRTVERDLIAEYQQRLVNSGIDGFDFDAASTAYRQGAMYGVFDCGALRDRGWGPRYADVQDQLRAGWPYVFASAESGWHLYDPQLAPFDEGPVDGTTETVTTGFFIRDGVEAQVVKGTRRAERGRDGRVLTQVIDCVDELGRELHAVGKSLNWLKWLVHSDILVWWSLVRWEYDGQVVYGEDQDFMNFRHYRKLWMKLLADDPDILNYFPENDPDYPPYGG